MEQKKRAVLAVFADAAASGRLVIGQNVGHAESLGSTNYFTNLFAATGRRPALLGLDLGFNDLSHLTNAAGRATVIESLVRWQADGGIVTLSMHPGSPTTRSNTWVSQSNQLVTNVVPLLTVGTPERTYWIAVLDRAAVVLSELRDRGVVVLWRPLHEMNGAWFWWGKWAAPDQFAAFWRDMHDYFTRVKGLDNLLWVFCANYVSWLDPSAEAPTATYWPGDGYVDAVALDYYGEDPAKFGQHGGYADLVAKGKPLVFGELGPSNAQRDGTFDNMTYLAIKDQYPKLAAVLSWHSWTEGAVFQHVALADCLHAPELMTNTRAVPLEKTGLR